MSNAPPDISWVAGPGIAQDWKTRPAQAAFLSWTDDAGNINRLTFDLVKSEKWNASATVTEHPVEVGPDISDHVRVALVTCELEVRSTNEPIGSSNVVGSDATEAVRMPLSVPTASVELPPGPGYILVPQVTNPIALRALAGTVVGLVGNLGGQRAAEVAALAGAAAAAAIFEPVIVRAPGGLPVSILSGPNPGAPPLPIFAQTQQYPTPTDFVRQTHDQLKALKDEAQILWVTGTKDYCTSMVIESLVFTRDSETGTGEDITIGLKEIRTVSTTVVAKPIDNLSAPGPPVNHGMQNPVEAPPATAKASITYFASHHK